MGNNRGKEAISIAMTENYLASGLTATEWANIVGVDRTTFNSRMKKYTEYTGKPLPEKSSVRNEEIVYKFKEDMENGNLPFEYVPPVKTEPKSSDSVKMDTNEVKMDVKPVQMGKNPTDQEEIKPESTSKKKWNEGEYRRFGMQISNEEFFFLQSYASVTGRTMQEVIIEALHEYYSRNDRTEDVSEAKKISSILMRRKK